MNTINKAVKTLDFVVSNASAFENQRKFKVLFCYYVRVEIEFYAVIRSPLYNIHDTRIERIQNRFLRFASKRFDSLSCAYSVIKSSLNFPSISSRFFFW